jgi:hypothetical protein
MQLMTTNICTFKDPLVICGTCLPEMDQIAFNKLPNPYFVCLETIHMNMVAHKIASIIEQGNVKRIILASVDKSPHCIQLHHIGRELNKMFNIEIKNYVAKQGELIEISKETIGLSKNLSKLQG